MPDLDRAELLELLGRLGAPDDASVLAVRLPTVPLAGNRCAARWKRITERSVPEPK